MLKSERMDELHIFFLIVFLFFITINLAFSQQGKEVFVNINIMKPQYSNNGSNSTNFMRKPILLYTKWDDNINLSHAILWTNETGGTGKNYTDNTYGSPETLDGLSDWSNFTWNNQTLTGSKVIAWKIYANDTLGYENVTSEMIFYTWGWSNITWISPDDGTYTTWNIIKLTCNVSDTNTSKSIANYPVYFYNVSTSGSSLIGSNLTNSSGYAVYHWNVSNITGGTYYPKCNITDNETLRYNASEYYEANTTIKICNVKHTMSSHLAAYIYFGQVDPGTNYNEAEENPSNNYYITDSSDSTCTGLQVWIRAIGDMVHGGSSIEISNVTVSNISSYETNGFRLSTSFQLLNSTVPVGSQVKMYFWLDVPEDQGPSGVYSTNVEIKENATCFS